jgi:hypothetical protein
MAPSASFVIHLIGVLVVNAIPVVGIIWLGWSAGTVLVLLWLETLMTALANLVRIRLHRVRSRRAGHWEAPLGATEKAGRRGPKPTYGRDYAVVVFVFSGAHGLFLIAILFMAFANQLGGDREVWRVGLGELGRGVSYLALAIVADLGVELSGLGERSFYWLKHRVEATLGRVLALHLAIIFGMLLMAKFETPLSLLAVFLGLKAGLDLLSVQGRELSGRPPRWFLWLARRMGRDGEAEYRDLLEKDAAQREQWDRVVG